MGFLSTIYFACEIKPVMSKPRLIFLLNSAQRHLLQWMAAQQTSQVATPPTPSQSGLLFVLDKADGASMGQLAQALDMEAPGISGLVQRTEALGWVTRQPCTQDGRTQRVWLTPHGRQQLPPLMQALAHINARLTAGFTDDELHTVAKWLEHVRHLDTHHHREEP
jgi:DNA-binding MarR family transcriptional regulator